MDLSPARGDDNQSHSSQAEPVWFDSVASTPEAATPAPVPANTPGEVTQLNPVMESTDRLSEHLIENWTLLVAMSRKIAGNVVDADDLLSDALLSTFARWQKSSGSIDHLNAYIIRAMQNRVKDEIKSPRSRIGSLENEELLQAPRDPEMDRIELVSEITLVRAALDQLPEDQREVLQAMFYHDQNPGQLTKTLQRSRPAVSMLAKRAKNNLKRTMLKLMLEKGDPHHECRHAASQLPRTVGEQPPSSGVAGDHFAGCKRCKSVWARFGTLGAASIGAFLVLGQITGAGFFRPAAAAAATHTAATTGTADASESATVEAESTAWTLGRKISTAVLAVAGAVIIAALMWVLPQQFSEETGQFDVQRTVQDAGGVSYHVQFDSNAEGWRVETLEISSAVLAVDVSAPDGWVCSIDSGAVTCSTENQSPVSDDFVVTYDGASAPKYSLTLRATTPSGSQIVGTATENQSQILTE